MIEPEHLRLEVIRPTLERMKLWSPAAENLLMGTAAQESAMGRYLVQLGRGPALGIYQMEPRTHDDLWDRYLLPRKEEVVPRVRMLLAPCDIVRNQLVWNLGYATGMARVFYLRVPKALPEADDIDGLAHYWKRWWNTHLGAGTVDQFKWNYKRYVLGEGAQV